MNSPWNKSEKRENYRARKQLSDKFTRVYDLLIDTNKKYDLLQSGIEKLLKQGDKSARDINKIQNMLLEDKNSHMRNVQELREELVEYIRENTKTNQQLVEMVNEMHSSVSCVEEAMRLLLVNNVIDYCEHTMNSRGEKK